LPLIPVPQLSTLYLDPLTPNPNQAAYKLLTSGDGDKSKASDTEKEEVAQNVSGDAEGDVDEDTDGYFGAGNSSNPSSRHTRGKSFSAEGGAGEAWYI
jgi:hypothetical protein